MAFYKNNDVDLYYEISGSGGALVLVHGWGADHTDFEEQMKPLSEHFELLVYDHRGHGKSSNSPDMNRYNIDQFSEDLKGLLDDLGKKKIHLLGHSMGGSIALSFAIKYPEYVNKLILASTFAERKMSFSEKIQLNIARLLPISLIAIPFVNSCLSKPDKVMKERIFHNYENAGKDTLLNSARSIGNINFIDDLDSVKAETIIIHGDEDKAVPFKNGRQLHEGIKGSKLFTIKNGPHVIMWENSDEFNSIIIDFLK